MSQRFVITGTSRGIGLELARQALEKGTEVVALARNPESSAELVALKKKYSDRLTYFPVDVTSDRDIESFTRDLGGKPVDVLINNAGVLDNYELKLGEISFKEIEDTFRTNTLGPMKMTRALLPNLHSASQPKVVSVTSLMGSIGDNTSGGAYGYRISKAALNMFTKNFALEDRKIVSIVINPGWVKTDMGGESAPTAVDESVRGILNVTLGLKPSDSGKFFDFDGEELPW